MYCSKCGKELKGNEKFCVACEPLGNVPQEPAMNHRFKVTGGWTRYYFLGFLLVQSLVITPTQMLFMLMLEIPPENTLTGVIGVGIFMELLAVAGYILFIVTSKSITVSGPQLTIRKVLKETVYNCSDIVNIRCGLTGSTRGKHYDIELTFRDRTEYKVIKYSGNKFKEFAVYLLQMKDAGVLTETAVTPEHMERLHLYAQGEGWMNRSGGVL